MRISIWQQWSSNHSAAFAVIGKFKTVEEAQQAGSTARNILVEVARWKQNDHKAKWRAYCASQKKWWMPPKEKARFNYNYYWVNDEPTEIEQQFARQHNLTWTHSLCYARDPELVPQAVKIADRVVIISEDFIGYYTWTGSEPFPELLKKLGGEVAVDSELRCTSVRVTIRCRASDESTATQIWQHVQKGEVKYDIYPPDELFHVNDLPPGPEKTSEWVYGNVSRDGLELTFTYDESDYGRYFIRLLNYLRTHNCTFIDYTFEEE